MANINNPERLKVPLKDKTGYFYPITSYNQIIMPNGNFWNGESSGSGGDAVTLNGMTFEELKKAILSEAVYQ